jgi:hypothetical protein
MTFHIKEHIIPSQHIRQHDNCGVQTEKAPRLDVKQYSPTNYVPAPGDITIIAAHGNGFVKVFAL